jgi:hypothetical protein
VPDRFIQQAVMQVLQGEETRLFALCRLAETHAAANLPSSFGPQETAGLRLTEKSDN